MRITEVTIPANGMSPVAETEETRSAASGQKPPESSQDHGPADRRETVRRKNAAPAEISLTFNREEAFDYIGSEKDTARLDVEKAVSDMRRDSVLQEYQYFIGGEPDLEYDGDIDGRFFIKDK